MGLEQKVMGELKTAMLAKNEAGLRGLRAIKAAIILAKTSEGAGGELKEEDETKLLQKLIKRFADEMPNDFVHGTGPAVLPAAHTVIGDVICFEVAYDSNVRDSVDQGARLLIVQTNNASFGRKGESQQQLAMTRIRA